MFGQRYPNSGVSILDNAAQSTHISKHIYIAPNTYRSAVEHWQYSHAIWQVPLAFAAAQRVSNRPTVQHIAVAVHRSSYAGSFAGCRYKMHLNHPLCQHNIAHMLNSGRAHQSKTLPFDFVTNSGGSPQRECDISQHQKASPPSKPCHTKEPLGSAASISHAYISHQLTGTDRDSQQADVTGKQGESGWNQDRPCRRHRQREQACRHRHTTVMCAFTATKRAGTQ